MPVIITITNGKVHVDGYSYSYYDRILQNFFTKEFEIFYSGQNQGVLDHQLLNAIANNDTFKIYYRQKKNMSFVYLGETEMVEVTQNRKAPIGINCRNEEKLHLHMNVRNIENEVVPRLNFTGSGKYKKDIFVHSGLITEQGAMLIPHNKNTNLGFYYY
jgi:hypothetical protein